MVQVNGYEVEVDQPTLTLVGRDGNAFGILSNAKGVMRKAGWPKELQDEVMEEAKNGDYDHLLQTMMKYFDVE